MEAAHRNAPVGPRVEVSVVLGAGDEQLGHPVLQVLGRLVVLLRHGREEVAVLLAHAVLEQGSTRARRRCCEAAGSGRVHRLARQAALPAPQLRPADLALHEPLAQSSQMRWPDTQRRCPPPRRRSSRCRRRPAPRAPAEQRSNWADVGGLLVLGWADAGGLSASGCSSSAIVYVFSCWCVRPRRPTARRRSCAVNACV